MGLIIEEWKKLFRLPALWGFILLCLAFNALLIFTNTFGSDFLNDTSKDAAALGRHIDQTFIDTLTKMPQTDNRDLLAASVSELDNLFEYYDVNSLSQYYEKQVTESPLAVRFIQRKYSKVTERTEHLAETEAALDLYAGPMTHDSHQFLFGTLLRAVISEGCLLAMLGMLYLLGHEHLTRTEIVFCTTRKGRKLWHHKITAGLTAGIGYYLLLTTLTLGLYFSLWDYSGIWSASVSSQFNYVRDLLIVKPFITWADFTVSGYLTAFLIMGAVMTVLFCLLAAICGLCIRNTYLAAMALILICTGGLSLTIAFANLKLWVPYLISNLQIMCLWLAQNVWFTESGLNAFLPWHETVGACINLIILGLSTVLSLKYFNRKDVL